MLDTKKCYIRHKNSSWIQGRTHHETALKLYISFYVNNAEPGSRPEEEIISTPHINGGDFVARFSYVDGNVYKYVNESGDIIYIMMEEPERVAFINRIVDY